MEDRMEEVKETELIDYLRVIWKWKFLIISGTVLSSIIAAFISLTLPKIYQATTTFLVTASPIIQEDKSGGTPEAYYELFTETFKGIINNNQSLVKALNTFKLSQEPYNLSLERFSQKITVKSVPDSKLLKLTIELDDPNLSADIANFLADNAVDLNVQMNQGDTLEARRFLEEEVNKAETELKEAEKNLLEFQGKAQVEEMRNEIETLLYLKSSLSKQLAQAEVDLTSEIGKEEKLASEIKNNKPVMTLTSSLAENPAYMQLILQSPSIKKEDAFNLEIKTEKAREAYEAMEGKLFDSRGMISYLQSRKEALTKSLSEIEKKLNKLQAFITKNEIEEKRLKNRYELSFALLHGFRKKLEETNLNVAAKSQDLKVLDPAIPPSHPIKPKKKFIVATSFIMSGLGFLILAFLLEYLGRMRKEGKLGKQD